MLRCVTMGRLKNRNGNSVLYLMNPPKAKGASVTGSLTHTVNERCIHVSLKKVRGRTRVEKREGACVNTVPKQVVGTMGATGMDGPLVLLSRVSGVTDSCGNSPTSTVLRILSGRRGGGFHSRFVTLPFSLSRAIFVAATGSCRKVPRPLLSEVSIVRVSNCARSRGMGVTGGCLLPGRGGRGKLASGRLGLSSGLVHRVVSNCAERSNIHGLRQYLKTMYEGATCSGTARKLSTSTLGRGLLEGCLKMEACRGRRGRGHGLIKAMAKLT